MKLEVAVNPVLGVRFPAGRITQVLIGPNGQVQADGFVMGRVVFDKGGMVPEHQHVNEECYFVVAGTLQVTVGGESFLLKGPAAIYIPPNTVHMAKNISDGEAEMLFVYSPVTVVEHWAEELRQCKSQGKVY